MIEQLVFDLGWSAFDVGRLTLDEIALWHQTAALRQRKRTQTGR